jgi:hypothetical protein
MGCGSHGEKGNTTKPPGQTSTSKQTKQKGTTKTNLVVIPSLFPNFLQFRVSFITISIEHPMKNTDLWKRNKPAFVSKNTACQATQ